MLRRTLLLSTASIGAAAVFAPSILLAAGGKQFEVTLPESEWKKRLSPEAFAVLRKHDTERPFSSPLDKEYRKGRYDCAGCELPLYDSSTKFDSKTGWPSFWAPIEGAVGTEEDRSFLIFGVRTEVHCRRCGGHLGHVFDDGPPPTGKRHCINGVALRFTPAPMG
jgi:peptide-methionine (R)-S-oxide reductase